MTALKKSEITGIKVPLRPGITVQIVGVPWDLTKFEAEKIAATIIALSAQERDDGR